MRVIVKQIELAADSDAPCVHREARIQVVSIPRTVVAKADVSRNIQKPVVHGRLAPETAVGVVVACHAGTIDGIEQRRDNRAAVQREESLVPVVLVHARRGIVAEVKPRRCRDVAGNRQRRLADGIGLAVPGASDDDAADGGIRRDSKRSGIRCGARDDEVVGDGDDEGFVAGIVTVGERHLFGGERRTGGCVRGKPE